MSELWFSLLGPVRGWLGDHELDLGSPQQRSLLAMLLLRPGIPVTIDEAVKALWDDAAPPTAEGTVRTYIYRLRRWMTQLSGPQQLSIHSHSGGYLLTTNGAALDIEVFRHRLDRGRRARREGQPGLALDAFRECLALWRGAPIAGAYSAYFDAERERLEQLRDTVIEEKAATEIELGDHAEALVTAKAALDTYPMRERLWELRIRALSGLGRRADALTAYQDARQVLRDELGLEPGPALRDLHGSLLAAGGTCPAAAPSPAPEPAPAPSQLPEAPADFSVRWAELTTVVTHLLDEHESRPLALVGPSCTGKTALALRAAHLVRCQFPDGQLHAALGGRRGAAAAPEDTLAHFLRSLGCPESNLRGALPQLADRWRAATENRRLLLLLDDVQDSGQLLPLLPASSRCAVLVTSRHRLLGRPGLHFLPLSGLPNREAEAQVGPTVGYDRFPQDVGGAARLVAS